MEAVFLKLLNMSIVAGWLILAVLIIRPILTKAPKWIRCAMWSLVALRLIFPFSIESILSLIPSSEPIPQEILTSPAPEIDTEIGIINSTVNPIISESLAPEVGASVNPMQIVATVSAHVWALGVAAMLIYALVSFIRVKLSVKEAYLIEENIFACDSVKTPFIFGFIRPRIYLMPNMNEEDKGYVVAHEKAHIKRGDHIWKMLAFFILAVYWFNPLVWISYICFCRDIELACDEKVIKTYDGESKKAYSSALLNCAVHKRLPSVSPACFAEVGVKSRIKNVLSYKKPAFWVIIICVLIIVIAAVFLLTDPKAEREEALVGDGIKIIDVGCDRDDVRIRVEEFVVEGNQLIIKYLWDNGNTQKSVLYGEMFSLEKKEKNKFVSISENEGSAWELIGYTVPPPTYSTMGNRENEATISAYYTLPEGGKYRFVKEFSCKNEYDVTEQYKYKAWVEFTITDEAVNSLKEIEIIRGKRYVYRSSEAGNCILTLNEKDKSFSLFLGYVSSYFPSGTYEETDVNIVLKVEGTEELTTHVFQKNGYNLRYDKRASIGRLPDCIPDLATFELPQKENVMILASHMADMNGDGEKETLSIMSSALMLNEGNLLVLETSSGAEISRITIPSYYDCSHANFWEEDGNIKLKLTYSNENESVYIVQYIDGQLEIYMDRPASEKGNYYSVSNTLMMQIAQSYHMTMNVRFNENDIVPFKDVFNYFTYDGCYTEDRRKIRDEIKPYYNKEDMTFSVPANIVENYF